MAELIKTKVSKVRAPRAIVRISNLLLVLAGANILITAASISLTPASSPWLPIILVSLYSAVLIFTAAGLRRHNRTAYRLVVGLAALAALMTLPALGLIIIMILPLLIATLVAPVTVVLIVTATIICLANLAVLIYAGAAFLSQQMRGLFLE